MRSIFSRLLLVVLLSLLPSVLRTYDVKRYIVNERESPVCVLTFFFAPLMMVLHILLRVCVSGKMSLTVVRLPLMLGMSVVIVSRTNVIH